MLFPLKAVTPASITALAVRLVVVDVVAVAAAAVVVVAR